MFGYRHANSRLGAALATGEVIFHNAARKVRAKHNNAILSLVISVLQSLILIAVFYGMFELLGMRRTAVRGDFLLYLMSGVFLFQVHIKAVAAVQGAEGPTSPMMLHAPMNTFIAIAAAALSALYLQILTVAVILFLYDALVNPITIEQPVPALGMLLLAWFSGIGVGLVFLAIKPWFPTASGILSTIYQRANMLFSGKMVLANSLPAYMLPVFDWNPLFHAIDQARGFVFINYYPHVTSWHYTLWVGLALCMIGLMGEFYTRRHSSLSWFARR
ncbi:ABC transporter permease [Jhaorihella thermophila]|uniref:ABC-type polysaccharide/polyol phosphate export permease n=1 Tax=Jhaorihella thermophila TaxID=488547 RepID=A0A1H5VLP8_9RHOB|nr:ABC transporter permease [Jhaorihella thermophila]SEF88232.1 ABC-type polysaccharide/polyol phosphate export permease [Jhaorihella thermophila]